MSAPTITARALTFEFSPSITGGIPDTLEIAVTPLDVGNAAAADVTFVGGVQAQTLELSQPTNSVIFDLVPSNSPSLDVPVNYRVMWRIGITGATQTYDFAMPDDDLTWAELIAGPSAIIGGETYLQQSDLGVANRVAQLNSSGIPETSTGTAVALSTDITTLTTNLATETTNRQAAITSLTSSVSTQVANSASTTLTSAENYTNTAVGTLNSAISGEAGTRAAAVTGLQTQITNNLTTLTDEINSVAASTGGNTTALDAKADLVDGLVPTNELPPGMVTTAVTASNQAAMLALTGSQVAPGDLCVRPDGTFLLTANPPATLSNWTAISQVTSVNGHQGAVSLAASDVGAMATGASVSQSQVTGLSTALSNLATASALASLQSTVATILGDTSYVHTSSGVIPNNKLNTDVVTYTSNTLSTVGGANIPLNVGTITSVNGQTGPSVTITPASLGAMATGASVTQSQVTGLSTALGLKADLTGPGTTVPLSELPSIPQTQVTGLSTALSNCAQLTGGLISLSNIPALPQSQVTGLPAILTSNGLTSSSTAMATIASIQSALTNKADLTAGVLSASEIPTNIPQSSVTGLTTALSNCATLTSGTVPLSQMPQNIPQSYVTGLVTALANTATLSGGVVPLSELPPLAMPNFQFVVSTAAMTALTTSQVGPGSIVGVTGGSGQGAYVLTGSPPSNLASWTMLPAPSAAVTSVNGHTGAVTLAASDVNAIAVGASISQSQVTGLPAALAALPSTYATISSVSALPTTSTIQSYLNSSGSYRADYVATSAIPSLSGQQSIDGVLIPTGATVLVTAQASSVANGLWVCSGSAWSRPANYATTFYVTQGALVVVDNQTGGANGLTHNETLWQQSAASGVIDTNGTSWSLTGYVSTPFAPTQGNGITITGNTFAAKAATGGGLQVSSGGIGVNRSTTPQWFSGILPASTSSVLTHNLNNPFPQVTIWDTSVSPPQIVLAPVQATTANEITVFFNSTPASNQYWATCVG